MFDRLGAFTVRRRRWILVATAVFFVLAGAVGGGVADRLSSGGFNDPDAEATRATEVLRAEFGQQTPNL
ncbi:MAG: putative drug exporter of the superfamily, partial [Actinomycetota bacterium]|nr:putative drug exporter of the superfamily [Actinomycetota bacterium]